MSKLLARELTSTCVVNARGRRSNLKRVMALGLPVIEKLPERGVPLAIVASGPSVRDYLDELRGWTGEIWAINGAYDYLKDNGIVPDGFFSLDPLKGLTEYIKGADHKTTFYLASTCNIFVFRALKDHTVKIFHAACEDVDYPKDWIIGGGTTSLTRVPYLGLLQGFRDITLYGADSSFEDGDPYCYQWGRYKHDINNKRLLIDLEEGGPVFETELGLMKQVSQMGVIHKNFRGRLTIKCGGLMDAFLKANTRSDDWFEMDKASAA